VMIEKRQLNRNEERTLIINDASELYEIIGNDELLTMLNIQYRHKEIMMMKWKEGLRFSVIARRYGMSESHIRNIYKEAILILSKRISFAINEYYKTHKVMEENQKLKAEIEQYRMMINKTSDEEKVMLEYISVLQLKTADINDLSIRSKNVLAKHNVITLGDLIEYSSEDLYNFKNLG
jgi:hypothetical protein